MRVSQSFPVLGAACAAAMLLSAVPAQAASLMDALTGGSAKGDLRYRYEQVNQDGFNNDAGASTLRTRLGYQTDEFQGANLYVEFENITTVDGENYNSTTNGLTTYPVVADPEGSEVNRAYLQYKRGKVALKFGRQRIILDSARHVGNVGWRQNEQTYDAVRLDITPVADLALTYAYIGNVNGITFGDTDHDSHLINLAYPVAKLGKVSAYGYLINNDDAPATSSASYGLRFKGKANAGAVSVGLTLEAAKQDEYANSGINDSDYLFGELAATHTGVTAKVGYELLSGDGTTAYQTPLATKHAFNGWADKFLATPADGLQDLMFTLSGKVAGIKLVGTYHDFSADNGSADYGTEVDLVAVKKIGKHNKVGVKYADYSADTHSVDTDKLWLFAQTAF